MVVVLALAGCRLGFDELRPATDAPADAATCVHPCNAAGTYRSVGPGNLAALAQGTSLSIAGTTATFSTALPDSVGVGDVIVYDAKLAFITERVSATEYLVAAELDGPPDATASTSWSVFRAYTSLSAAARGETNPSIAIAFDSWTGTHVLTAPWHIACYADAVDTGQVQINNWDTSAANYVRIFTPVAPFEVGTSQRHPGRWDDSRYSLQLPSTTDDRAIEIVDADARIEGLQIFIDSDDTPGDLPYGIDLHGTVSRVYHVSESIIRGNNTPTPNTSIPRGIKVDALTSNQRQTLYAYNNVIYDLGGGIEVRGIEMTGDGSTVYSFNNTIANLSPAILGNDPTDVAVLRNTLVLACASPCLGGAGTYSGSNNVGPDFADFSIGVDPTGKLGDYVLDGSDFHLDATAPQVIDQGLDLSSDPDLPFTLDVDHLPRTGAWDIGADER